MKIKSLIGKLYGDGWFNLFCVLTATALGYTQMWLSIVFAGLYLAGFVVYDNNKVSIEELMKKINEVKAQLNKK